MGGGRGAEWPSSAREAARAPASRDFIGSDDARDERVPVCGGVAEECRLARNTGCSGDREEPYAGRARSSGQSSGARAAKGRLPIRGASSRNGPSGGQSYSKADAEFGVAEVFRL